MTLAGIPVPGHFLHVLLHRRSKVPTLGWGDHGGDREALPRPLRLQCLAAEAFPLIKNFVQASGHLLGWFNA